MIYTKIEKVAFSALPDWLNPSLPFLGFVDGVFQRALQFIPSFLKSSNFFITPIEVLHELIGSTQTFIKEKKRGLKKPLIKLKETIEESVSGGMFVAEGILERGLATTYSVEGRDFFLSDQTWMFGELKNGIKVRLVGRINPSGDVYARKITIIAHTNLTPKLSPADAKQSWR